jgi:hypothetical protein
MQEFSGVGILGSTLRMKSEVDLTNRGQKDFICREEKKKVAWSHAAGPGDW